MIVCKTTKIATIAQVQWRPRYAHISLLTQLCDETPTSVMISHVIRSAHHSELVVIQTSLKSITLKYIRVTKVIMGLNLNINTYQRGTSTIFDFFPLPGFFLPFSVSSSMGFGGSVGSLKSYLYEGAEPLSEFSNVWATYWPIAISSWFMLLA